MPDRPSGGALRLPGASLQKLQTMLEAGGKDVQALDARIRQALRLEEEIETRLVRLMAQVADVAWNLHHPRGEHGGPARCRGRAPLDVVWSLGRGGCGGKFRNEIRC